MTATTPRRVNRRTGAHGQAPRTSIGSLCARTRSPASVPGALPGATPRSRETVTGINAFVTEMQLTPADARRLRDESLSHSPSSRSAARGDGQGNERRPVRNPRRRQAQPRARDAHGRHPGVRPRRKPPDASPSRVFQARAAGQRPSRTSAMSSGSKVAACSSWGTRVPVPSSGPCRKVHGRSMSAQTGSARSAARPGCPAGNVAGNVETVGGDMRPLDVEMSRRLSSC